MTDWVFTRRDGTRFRLRIEIDQRKLADDLARTMVRRGGKGRITKCAGAIVATRTEVEDAS